MFKRFNKMAAVAAVVVAAGLARRGRRRPAWRRRHSASTRSCPVARTRAASPSATSITPTSTSPRPATWSSTAATSRWSSPEENNKQFLAFLLNVDVGAAQHADLVIGYDVTVLDPARHIKSVGLVFEGGPNGNPSGRASASVTETVYTLDGSDLVAGGEVRDSEMITVFNDGDGFLPDNTDATMAINPARGLRFTKDIIISARANTEGAGVSVVENSVTQNGTAIPLPAAFWAAMPIFGGIAAHRKLRRLATRN